MILKGIYQKFPGIGSYSGRYAYFSLTVCLTLMILAYMGWEYVNRNSRVQIRQIETRSMTAGVLNDSLSYLNLLENTLQRIIIEPDAQDLQLVEVRLSRLGFILEHLEDVLQDSQTGREIARELQKDLGQLEDASRDLIAIRSDVVRWFPALRLMQEEMFPHNQQLITLLDGLLIEIEEELPAEAQLSAYKAASALRSTWTSMISEMRLYVANRFGIFASEFRSGMESRRTNVVYYEEEVPVHIKSLRRMAADGRLGQLSDFSLDEIEEHYQAWSRAFNQLSRIIDNPDWRMDLLLMGEAVEPILDRMRQRLSSLGIDLNTQAARDITQMTDTAKQLSKAILGIAVAVILLIVIAYLFLFRYLLKPIAQTAMALKQEAQGVADIQPPPAILQETRDLVDAFTEMRRQVHTRQRSLDHMAYHDALTQLPNRALFRDRLQHAIAVAERCDTLVGLLFLDLDRFKQVNDSLGHLVGDELLKVVAQRLQSLVRASDTVARLSGDEFAILVEKLETRDAITSLAAKALEVLKKPMQIAEHRLYISASIGIVLAPVDDNTVELLLRDADAAMYEAKRQGRANYRFFTGDLASQAKEGLHLENALRQGVELNQIIYHYQPVISLKDGDLLLCEALLRWRHPDKGLLLPEAFMHALDATGLSASIMDDLLDQANQHQREMSYFRQRRVAVSINLSVRLLNDPVFCRGVVERLAAGQFREGGLVLELTEDILTEELAEAESFLQQVRSLGGKIALDDFGTGQSSLSHLRQFPFDLLKIDRDFIQLVDSDPMNANLVEAIIKLAHALDMPVIAEGVETSEQYQVIKALGCDYIQGYLSGKPEESCKIIQQQVSLD